MPLPRCACRPMMRTSELARLLRRRRRSAPAAGRTSRRLPPVRTFSWWPSPRPRSSRNQIVRPRNSSGQRCSASMLSTRDGDAARERRLVFGARREARREQHALRDRSPAAPRTRARVRPATRIRSRSPRLPARAGSPDADWPSARRSSGRRRRRRAARARVRAPSPGRRRSAACRRSRQFAAGARAAPATTASRAAGVPCAISRQLGPNTPASCTGIAPLRISCACSCGIRPSASASSTTKVRLRSFDDCEIRCTRSRPNVAQMSDSRCSSERMPRPTSVIAAHGAITLTRHTSARSALQRFEHVAADQVLARDPATR